MQLSEINRIVLESLDAVLAAEDTQPTEPLAETTRLIGRGSVLDSLGLVNLIIEVEARLQAEHGVLVTVADDRAMSQLSSPFRTVSSLSEYVAMLVQEQSVNA